MLQLTQNAIGVEYMPTSKLNTRFLTQVASVADGADLIALASTSRILAWEALMLLLNSVASVTTSMNFSASFDFRYLSPCRCSYRNVAHFLWSLILLDLFLLITA